VRLLLADVGLELFPTHLRMNNVIGLTQPQKLAQGVRVAPHLYILM